MVNKKLIFFITILLTLVFFSKEGNAKTFAHLIGTDGKAIKIDTDADTIVATQALPEAGSYIQSDKTNIAADATYNHLFVVVGRKGSKVLVYDLKTLSFIKELGIYSPNPDISISITPDGKKVFVVWWNPELEEGAWQFDVFDGVTLEKITTLDFYFYPKQVTFSGDSSKLYSIEEGDWSRIKVVDMSTLKLVSSIDLNTIWNKNGFLPGIEDYKAEKIVIRESKKVIQDSSPEITYFVYDLKNKTSTSRISTVIAGDVKLSSDGNKLFINDEDSIWSEDKKYVMYRKSSGRLHVYDVAAATEKGIVPFTVDRESRIVGIHPSGNKIYVMGHITDVKTLISLDSVNFKVTNTIKIPDSMLFMIFFEE